MSPDRAAGYTALAGVAGLGVIGWRFWQKFKPWQEYLNNQSVHMSGTGMMVTNMLLLCMKKGLWTSPEFDAALAELQQNPESTILHAYGKAGGDTDAMQSVMDQAKQGTGHYL